MAPRALVLLPLALLLVFPVLAEETAYSFLLEYEGGAFTLREVQLVLAPAEIRPQSDGRFELALHSFSGAGLYATHFNVATDVVGAPRAEWFDESGKQVVFPQEGAATLSRVAVAVAAPYFPEAQRAVVSEDGRELLAIPLEQFATCNANGRCDPGESPACGDCGCGDHRCLGESYLTCSADCPSGGADGVCDRIADAACDPDCSSGDLDCPRTPRWIFVVIALAGAVVLAGIVLRARR